MVAVDETKTSAGQAPLTHCDSSIVIHRAHDELVFCWIVLEHRGATERQAYSQVQSDSRTRVLQVFDDLV